MPRQCSICAHEQRAEIEGAIVAGESAPSIGKRYRVSADAVLRHKAAHIAETLIRAAQTVAEVQTQQTGDALDVMAELKRCFERVNLLFDSCDRWLRDPEEPSQYTLEPRANEVKVIYTEPGPNGKPVQKKTRLSTLLSRLEGKTVLYAEIRHADPRDLILKTAAQLKSQQELLTKLIEMEDIAARLAALEQQMGVKA